MIIQFSQNNIPYVDGKAITKIDAIHKLVLDWLSEIGYTFIPYWRPVPAVISNFRSLKRSYTCKWFRNSFETFYGLHQELFNTLPQEFVISNSLSKFIFENYCLTDLDWQKYLFADSKHIKLSSRLVRVYWSYHDISGVQHSMVRFLPLDEVPNFVNRFFAPDSNFCKSITIN